MPEPDDELIGKWFHSWHTVPMGGSFGWEGQIVSKVSAQGMYIVMLLDGETVLFSVDMMAGWKLFDSLESLMAIMDSDSVIKIHKKFREPQAMQASDQQAQAQQSEGDNAGA
jgi:hypothetical protein